MNIMMFAHGGSLNRGCEAIVRSTAGLLKEHLNGAKVYLASDRPGTDRDIPNLDEVYDAAACELRRFTPEWLLSSLRVKLYNDESYALGRIHRKLIRHIPQMDVLLSIGGDNYCYGEQPAWYEIDRRVKACGKKLVLWGCSIGEEDLSERKLNDLALFDLILARETLTCETLTKHGLTNVRLCADPAFTLGKEELPLPEGWQEGNTIGINFSPLVRSRNRRSEAAVHDLIAYILRSTDMTIALTPHVIQEGNNDCDVLAYYYEQFKHTRRVLLLPDHLNAVQYKGYISRMRMFIGARTHATIAAYSSLVPTMVLGYSIKSRGIAKDLFGVEKLVLGIDDLSDSGKLRSAFDELVREERALYAHLKTAVPSIKQMSHKAITYLNELAV